MLKSLSAFSVALSLAITLNFAQVPDSTAGVNKSSLPSSPSAKAKPSKSAAVKSNTATNPQAVVITVGGSSIKKVQIDTLVHLMAKQRSANGPVTDADIATLEKLVATNLIGQELLDQEAKKQKLVVTDKEVDSIYKAFKANFPDEKTFARALKETGEDEKALKTKLVRQVKADKLLNGQVGQLQNPTDPEIAEFFEQNKKLFPISDSLRAAQILIMVSKDMRADSTALIKTRLEALRQDLLSDSAKPFIMLRRFMMAASQIGQGPERAAGGDLQRFKPTDFNAEFQKQLKSLKVGQISPIFRTPLGFHMIVLTERNDGKFESYKLAIAQLLVSQKTAKTGQDLRKYLQQLAVKYPVKYKVKSYQDSSPAGVYN